MDVKGGGGGKREEKGKKQMKRNTECKGRWDDRFLCAPPSLPPPYDRQFFLQPEKKIKSVSFPKDKKKEEKKKGYKAIKYSYCLGNEPSFGTNEGSIVLRFRLKFPVPKGLKVVRLISVFQKGLSFFFGGGGGQLSPELIVLKCHRGVVGRETLRFPSL